MPLAIADQPRHHVMGQSLGRRDQVGLVLAVMIVEHDDGDAGPQSIAGGIDSAR